MISLNDGKFVVVNCFGIFKLIYCDVWMGCNLLMGEVIQIVVSNGVSFLVVKVFKDVFNV